MDLGKCLNKNSKECFKMSNKTQDAIYDARKLGKTKMFVLGFQHMFAMFGATVLVPLLTGLDIATTLLMAGLGTLLFHFLTKGKVPAFLGSSFAFLGGYGAVAPIAGANGMTNAQLLPYACSGVAAARGAGAVVGVSVITANESENSEKHCNYHHERKNFLHDKSSPF